MMNWLRKYWWTLVAGVALVLGILVRGLFRTKKDVPSVADMAREEVLRAETDIKIEKVKVRAKAEAEKKQLEKIKGDPDDDRRRRRLASWLNNNL